MEGITLRPLAPGYAEGQIMSEREDRGIPEKVSRIGFAFPMSIGAGIGMGAGTGSGTGVFLTFGLLRSRRNEGDSG